MLLPTFWPLMECPCVVGGISAVADVLGDAGSSKNYTSFPIFWEVHD